MIEEEYAKVRTTVRNRIMRGFNGQSVEYSGYEDFGSLNDGSLPPLPDVTEQTEFGYVGLDAPLA
jgi:hypothetical protein